MTTAELVALARILDRAGFAYLEVSGGGVFDTAVRRGVESPWERIRALKGAVETPLALALRGRFLVGSRPVGGDFVRRFVATAAENGVEVFRLHDPLNDVSNLVEAGEAIAAAGREFDAGLVYGPGFAGEMETIVERGRRLPEIGASRVLLHDPSGALDPQRVQELVGALRDATGLPVGIYCQGSAGSALAAGIEAVRAGADLVACAVFPLALTLHRVSGEALAQTLAGLGLDAGVDVAALWEASGIVERSIGDEPVTPLAPRVAVRAAQHNMPAGLVAALDAQLRANAAGDRLDDVLSELKQIRSEAGWPPLAAPIGQILGSQALLHVLSGQRYATVVDELRGLLEGRYGDPPGPIDPTVRRALTLVSDGPSDEAPIDLDTLREEAEGLASSEEELLLLALFGDEAQPLLRTIRGRSSGQDSLVGGRVDQQRADLIREVVRIVQESGVAEVTIEEAGTRVSVRRTEERDRMPVAPGPAGSDDAPAIAPPLALPEADGAIRIESPMVGTFYRAPEPNAPPFVEIGDTIAAGQTLCILEAMKLMNELKAEAEGVVRSIHAENAQAVEYGQLLFELEPIAPPPLDAL